MDLVVDQDVDGLLRRQRRRPEIRVDADRPGLRFGPMRPVHVGVPRAGHHHLLDRQALEQVGIVERMIMGGDAEQDRILPRKLVEQEGATDDAGEFVRMLRDVAIIVDAIADAEPIEPRTEIEEHAELPAHTRLAEQHAARHAPQMPVAGKPAIVLVLVEEIENHVVGIVVECLCGHWVHPREVRCAFSHGTGCRTLPNLPQA
ncbi:hypothetical protein ACVWWK_002743 [Bradyrhizobium sp. LB9.1b]